MDHMFSLKIVECKASDLKTEETFLKSFKIFEYIQMFEILTKRRNFLRNIFFVKAITIKCEQWEQLHVWGK